MDDALEATIRERMEFEKERTEPAPDSIQVPPIPADRYADESIFASEQENIFHKSWLFAGHISEWPEEGSYRVFTRSRSPIVIVRSKDGELRAFYNSCRHRGAPVTRDECGTAKRLTCQYHSWSYGTDGELKAVPDERSFKDINKDELGLVPVRCEVNDGFVFISEDPEVQPLADFLGPLVEQMADINGTSLRLVGTQQFQIDCNWKLNVDAFLEVYHVRTVHPDNAALLYDDQSVTVSMLPNGNSRLTVEKREALRDMAMVSEEFDNPSVGKLWRQTSTSFGIFPNLIVPMDTGAFAFMCIWPLDSKHTELELRWYAPAWEGDEVPADHIGRLGLFETVMAQDISNMAPMQTAVDSPGASDFQIGWHERLIHHFHRTVDVALGDAMPEDLRVSDALDGFVEKE